jgi:hypothetical protein
VLFEIERPVEVLLDLLEATMILRISATFLTLVFTLQSSCGFDLFAWSKTHTASVSVIIFVQTKEQHSPLLDYQWGAVLGRKDPGGDPHEIRTDVLPKRG